MIKTTILLILSLSFLLISSMSLADNQIKNDDPPKIEIIDSAQFFDETFHDLQQELETTVEDKKQGLLIMFEMDECPFCQRMKETVLNRSHVQDYYKKHFRIIQVDIEGDLELTDFQGNVTTQKDFSLKQHRVRATPVFQFFDLKGKAIKKGRLTGASKNPEEFLLLGEYIVGNHYEQKSFFRFKQSQLKNTDAKKP